MVEYGVPMSVYKRMTFLFQKVFFFLKKNERIMKFNINDLNILDLL